jgi:hypothetical protein
MNPGAKSIFGLNAALKGCYCLERDRRVACRYVSGGDANRTRAGAPAPHLQRHPQEGRILKNGILF